MGEQITLTPFQAALKDPKMLEFASIRRSNIGIMAFHAGSIEPGTEQIARYVAQKIDSSYYIVSNRGSQDNERLHITSTSIFPQDSPLLFEFIKSIKTAVSIHGHERNDKIFVGGLNSLLRKDVAFELEKCFPKRVICEIEEIPVDLRGVSPLNIVNQPLEKGVQIELPEVLRPMDRNYDNPVENGPGLAVAKAISNAVKRRAGRY